MKSRIFKYFSFSFILSFIVSLILVLCLAKPPLMILAQTEQPQEEPPPTTQPTEQRNTWQAILNLFRRRKEPYRGSRPAYENVCPISPGLLEEQNTIWSAYPLFLWQETSFPLEIRLYSPFDPTQDAKVIWQQNLMENSPPTMFQGIQYTGEALEPGKIYDWELFNPINNTKLRRSFRVMDGQERYQITEELQNLEAQLSLQQATDEEIAMARANYFAQRNLWSDVLQEMYSVPNASPELNQIIQELVSYFCEVSNP